METKTPQNNYQILIKLLNGKHQTLNLKSPILPIQTLKHQIQTLTSIPPPLQLLTFPNSRIIDESTSLACDTSSFPVIVHLLLRLRGGKGGFGSLLRGAGTKAGQKKTNNFDACRDMSGRRLRHVNAEKKLEEWKAEADERKLEKMAEDYLKKKEKEVGKKRKNGKGEDAERYVAKYREDSAKCMEEVERTVRESLKGVLNLKRKGGNGGSESADAKRMKIWMGKRLADSDSDDMDDDSEDDDDEENEKSAVVDNGNNSGLTEEAYRSPDSVTDTQLGSISSENVTSARETETEKRAGPEENPCSAKIVDDGEDRTSPNDVPSLDVSVESGSESLKLENVVAINSHNDVPSSDALVESGSESIKLENVVASDPDNDQPTVGKKPSTSDLHEDLVAQVNAVCGSKSPSTETEILSLEKPLPLNFDDYNSAAEMEVLGMERLKSELQERGLKCGGNLQERAARLFLLKTTPLEKLPKKLFAKK